MKANIYHVIADNGEEWAEDHDERHEVVAAQTPEQAIEQSGLKGYYSRGSVEANLVYKDVEIPE